MPRHPEEVRSFIRANYKGTSWAMMAQLVKEKFGYEMTRWQVKGFYSRNGLNSGLTGRFVKGNIPPLKGKKGCYLPGCEVSWFKPGHESENKKPIGSERVARDGYVWVKIAEPDKWRFKHLVIWEERYKMTMFKECVVIFLDGNRLNTSLENLKAITRKENAVINKFGLRSNDAALTETGIAIAKLKIAKQEVKRRKSNESKRP